MAAPSVSTRLLSAELEAEASAVAVEAVGSVVDVAAMAGAMAATVEVRVGTNRVGRVAILAAVSECSTVDPGCILTCGKAIPAVVVTTSSNKAVAAGKFPVIHDSLNFERSANVRHA